MAFSAVSIAVTPNIDLLSACSVLRSSAFPFPFTFHVSSSGPRASGRRRANMGEPNRRSHLRLPQRDRVHVAGFDFRYSGPGDQQIDDHLFLFAPVPLQIAGGPDDGAIVCEPMTVDIDSVRQLFTDAEFAYYRSARGDDLTSRRRVEINGHIGERSITIYIFDEPFDDAEPKTILDKASKSSPIDADSAAAMSRDVRPLHRNPFIRTQSHARITPSPSGFIRTPPTTTLSSSSATEA